MHLFYGRNWLLLININLSIFVRINDINISHHGSFPWTQTLILLIIRGHICIIVIFVGVLVWFFIVKLCLFDLYWLLFVMNQGLNMTITTHLINFIDRNYRVNSLKVPFVFIIYVCLNSLFLLCNKLFFNSEQ